MAMRITLLHCLELRVQVGLLAWADLDEAIIDMAWHHLPAEDAAVIRRYQHEADRLRSLGARIALAWMWAQQGGLAGASVRVAHARTGGHRPVPDGNPAWPILSRLRKDPHGRPWLDAQGTDDMPSIGFSHAGAWSVCAVSPSGERIGVDIEQQPADPAGMDSIFSAEEHGRLRTAASAGVAANRALLKGWTIKEAALKAVGRGFLAAPQAWQIGPEWPAMEEGMGTIQGPQDSARWCHLESPPGYVLTVARLD